MPSRNRGTVSYASRRPCPELSNLSVDPRVYSVWVQERKGRTSPRDGGRDESPHLGAGKAGNGRDGLASALCVD